MLNSKGYTFIEMLIVLAIVMIVSTIALTFSYKKMHMDEFERSIEQFELDLIEIQRYASDNGVWTYCRVEEKYKLRCYERNNELLLERDYPQRMVINILTSTRRIEFTKDGAIINFGQLEFSLDQQHVFYSINIGKGRMRRLEK